MAKLGIAIIGLGMAVRPHARSLMDLADEADVRHAFSPSPARRTGFAAIYPFPLADSVDAILGDPGVDVVAILTPPNTHLDLVRRCAAAGKHILLEKPLETTLRRSEAVVATCRDAGVKLGVMLQYRHRPAAIRLRDVLASGRLGRIAGASAHQNWWRPQSYYDEPGRGTRARDGGGVLLTQAIHTLDLFQSLAGMPEEVCGYAVTSPLHRMETEDMVNAAIRFSSGAIGTIAATTAAYPRFPERIELICEHGTAVIAGEALRIDYHDGTNEDLPPPRAPAGGDPQAIHHHPFRSLWRDFLVAVRHGHEPPVSGADALNVHRLIDALLQSAKNGGLPVRLA